MDKPKSNKEKKDALRKHHAVVLKQLGAADNQYCPHMAFNHNGEQYMKFFPGELNMKKDLYTESISRSWEPEDEERHLLILRYGPHWKKYEQEDTNYKMYLVPVADMQPVEEVPETTNQKCKDLVSSGEDWELSEMTVRDLAAILWHKPVSCKQLINDLVKQEFKS